MKKGHYFQINQVKLMTNGMGELFAVPLTLHSNYISGNIQKHGQKILVLKTFL